MNDELLTIDELAAILKVKRSWCYAMSRRTDKDAIPRLKVGKYLRFRLPDVLSWLKERNEKNS